MSPTRAQDEILERNNPALSLRKRDLIWKAVSMALLRETATRDYPLYNDQSPFTVELVIELLHDINLLALRKFTPSTAGILG